MSSDSRELAIREKAYAKWEQAGCPASDGIHFWLEAENEIQSLDATAASSAVPTSKTEAASAFRAADPPPLKVPKSASPSRKRAG
jgi:hypothetical protein